MQNLKELHAKDWVQDIKETSNNSVDVTVKTSSGESVVFQVGRNPTLTTTTEKYLAKK